MEVKKFDYYYYFFSVPIGLYGFQHYISILGSLILIPLVIVPAMGGTYVSTLHSKVCFFGIKSPIWIFFCYKEWIVESLVWLDLVGVGGYCKCGINGPLCVGSDHAVAYNFRFKVALDTGPVVCLSGSSVGNNQLPGVSRTQCKCMFLLSCFVILEYQS